MSDNVENDQSENTAEEPAGPVCGERLVEARRARQIAVSEIAKELHLDEPKVLALERRLFHTGTIGQCRARRFGAPETAPGALTGSLDRRDRRCDHCGHRVLVVYTTGRAGC
jgi:hypothetical protein